MIDLTKLSSAPWHVIANKSSVYTVRSTDECNVAVIGDEEDEAYEWLEADAEFIALARNAFDVMMRRGWYAVPHEQEPKKTWVAVNAFCCLIERGGNTGTYFVAVDPFAALVEADKWYAANVEKSA